MAPPAQELRNRRSVSPPSENGSSPSKSRSASGAVTALSSSPPAGTTTAQAKAYNPAAYRVRLTSWKDFLHVLKARYMDTVFKVSALMLLGQIANAVAKHSPAAVMVTASGSAREALSQLSHIPVADACLLAYGELQWMAPVFLLMIGALLLRRGRSVYLVDFSTFEPPESWKISHPQLLTILRNVAAQRKSAGLSSNTEADIEFQAKVLENSGTGQATAWPPAIVRCLDASKCGTITKEDTRDEAETIICQCLESLFQRTGVQPKEVDFLIINCSLFSPTPSLCALACNKFRFRSSIKTYNLSGQGCSASLLSVDLASELLRANPNSIAVVVSTELISQSLYHGHEKGMLLQNTLFRSGGAAVMLTNKASRIGQARYRLRHLVRTQTTDDKSYRAVYEQEDAEGNCGVALSKEIVKVAGNAMAINLTQLGPLILPLWEQLKVVWSISMKKLNVAKYREKPKYVPSFKSAIHYFCIHSGGRAVLDGIEKNLRLAPEDMEPSRSVLREMGNTSSSSIWYELRHVEERMNIRRGHKVLQLAFGSGFKCNSAVWTRLR